MTTIDKAIDLDLAPVRRTIAMRFMDAAGFPAALLRVLRNRREIGNLKDLTDAQLADIGLTRSDVRLSLIENPFGDPSGYLTTAARGRRPLRRSI